MVPIEKVKDIISNMMLRKRLISGRVDQIICKKSKEYSSLGRIISAREYVNFENEKKDLENITRQN